MKARPSVGLARPLLSLQILFSVALGRAREFGIGRHFEVDLAQRFGGESFGRFVGFLTGENVATQCRGGRKKSESGAEAFEPGGIARLLAADFGLLQTRLARVGQNCRNGFGNSFGAARKRFGSSHFGLGKIRKTDAISGLELFEKRQILSS